MATATLTLEAGLDATLGAELPEVEQRTLMLPQAREWLRAHGEIVLVPEGLPCGGLVARGPGWRMFRHRGELGFTLLTAEIPEVAR